MCLPSVFSVVKVLGSAFMSFVVHSYFEAVAELNAGAG
jgi:hypothetical protein